jgi:hypothetical protein
MFTPLVSRAALAVAAGALAAMTASLPAFADTPTGPATNASISDDWDNPHMAKDAARSDQLLLERVRSAKDMIDSGKFNVARNEVDAAEDIAGAIRATLPFAAIVSQIKAAKTELQDGDKKQFHEDLLPLYIRLDALSIFAPDLAADTKVNLERAEFMADVGRTAGAEKAMDQIARRITASNVYIPVVHVYDELAAAHMALSRARPNVATAKRAVADAEDALLPS